MGEDKPIDRESIYRPYNRYDNFNDILGSMIRSKKDNIPYIITGFDRGSKEVAIGGIFTSLEDLFDDFTKEDGTPLGVEIKWAE